MSEQKSAPEGFQGKLNIYTCRECGSHIVTKDVDDGVTPFLVGCKSPGCKGLMQSSMYRVFDQAMKHSWEWYKPNSLAGLSGSEREHVRMGGLLMRPTP